MNYSSNIWQELEELLAQQLIKDYKIFASYEKHSNRLSLITLEDKVLEMDTNSDYCYKMKNDDFIYESFEQILRKNSNEYCLKFDEIIINKLNKLIENDNKDDNRE